MRDQPDAAEQHPIDTLKEGSLDDQPAPTLTPIRLRDGLMLAGFLLACAAVTALAVLLPRTRASLTLTNETNLVATPTVYVTHPKAGAPVENLSLPANVAAFTDGAIRARTSGYLSRWFFDIGSAVKKGDLLAEIASPEVDEQLVAAEGDLATAEANAANARGQSERYARLLATDSVSEQDADTYRNLAAATQAAVKSAQANVHRLQDLKLFEKVYAPFAGIITARNTDVGQLIDASSTHELFHLQAVSVLRVYVNLPEAYAQSIKPAQRVDLTFSEYPGEVVVGRVVRTAGSLDPASRSLLVEIDVDNQTGKLMPGSLAQANFHLATKGTSLNIPVSSVMFRSEGVRVATVDGNKIHLMPITIGRDDGQTVQVIKGLSIVDQLVLDPPDSVIEGERVRIVDPGEVVPK